MRGWMPVGVTLPRGRDQHHGVAQLHAQLLRQRTAEDHAIATRDQIIDLAFG